MAGNNLFGVDIAGIIHANISPGVLALTLTKSTPGTRTPGSLTAGTNPTEVITPGRGFIEDRQDSRRSNPDRPSNSQTERTDRAVIIIGNSLAGGTVVPAAGDTIGIEGESLVIVRVKRDPDKATYTCSVRGV